MNKTLKWKLKALLVFGAGLGLSLLFWDHFTLPFHNPLEVVGYCTEKSINPQDDVIRSAFFILFPALLGLLFLRDWKGFSERELGREPVQSRDTFWKFLLMLYAALIAVNVPTYHAFGRFDVFHEGESLGSALSVLQGFKPYRDLFFFHGLVQDPLRALAVRHDLGYLIGSERVWESGMKTLGWMFLALALLSLFRRNKAWAFGALSLLALLHVRFLFDVVGLLMVQPLNPQTVLQAFLTHSSFWASFNEFIFPSRDLLTVLWCWSFFEMDRMERMGDERRSLAVFPFLFAFVPVFGLVYSVDRGVYLILASLLVLGLARPQWRSPNSKFLWGSAIGGAVLAGMIDTFLLQGNWAGFIQFVFLKLPRFKELSEKLPYPIHEPLFFGVCAVFAGEVFFLALAGSALYRNERNWAAIQREYRIEATLLFLSLLFFRNVLARSEQEHLIYSLLPFYLLLFYQGWKYARGWSGRWERILKPLVLTLAVLMVVPIFREDVLRQNFPLGVPDDQFVLPAQKDLVSRLGPLIKPGDGFFTFTPEAGWYYLLRQPCPTPYPYLWTAVTIEAQKEVVGALEEKRVKWVLYRDQEWSWQIDGIPNDRKFPVIAAYLAQNYQPAFNVDGSEIWVRKKNNSPSKPASKS